MRSIQELKSGSDIRPGGKPGKYPFLGGQSPGAIDSFLIADLQIPIDRNVAEEIQITDRIPAALHAMIGPRCGFPGKDGCPRRLYHVTADRWIGRSECFCAAAECPARADKIAKRVDAAGLLQYLQACRFGMGAPVSIEKELIGAKGAALPGNFLSSFLHPL